jgi:hypothetical protein
LATGPVFLDQRLGDNGRRRFGFKLGQASSKNRIAGSQVS